MFEGTKILYITKLFAIFDCGAFGDGIAIRLSAHFTDYLPPAAEPCCGVMLQPFLV
jgi:hypothetical protein